MLDGVATAGIAFVAGGGLPVAARLGIAMVAIQAAIGTVNDIVDREHDQVSKAGKPLPRGLISIGGASLLAAALAATGLALSLLSGPPTAAVAMLGLAVGLAYDLRFKGTAWSWLPYAIGIPLLPVYAWLGARNEIPPAFVLLVPAGVAAGAALAIANAVADVERDTTAGVSSVAVALGHERAWHIHLLLHAAVFTLALGSLIASTRTGLIDPVIAFVIVALGGLLVGSGAALGRSASAARRERGWELEAIGIGLAALGWIGGIGSGG